MHCLLAIDLYAGKGGWTNGLQSCGYQCIGFDIADMGGYPGELVLQDVLTIHGSQFRNATLIVASPPCQNYSYLAMPWSRSKDPNNSKAAKALRRKWETEGPDNRLFDACFRIQREASEAAGCHIPMVVENVKGAQPWVGPAKAHFGSFYLWGDIESVGGRIVRSGPMKFGQSSLQNSKRSLKVPGFNFHQHEKTGQPGGSFQSAAVKGINGTWFGQSHGKEYDWRQQNPRDGLSDGRKGMTRRFSSRSAARKEASARIAMIPEPLARHIGEVYAIAGGAL